MKTFIDDFIDHYPWLAVFIVWLLWVGGLFWEYQTHRNKNVLRGGWFFLFCILAFGATNADALGNWKWLLATCVMGAGVFVLKLIGYDSKQNDGNRPPPTPRTPKPKKEF